MSKSNNILYAFKINNKLLTTLKEYCNDLQINENDFITDAIIEKINNDNFFKIDKNNFKE